MAIFSRLPSMVIFFFRFMSNILSLSQVFHLLDYFYSYLPSVISVVLCDDMILWFQYRQFRPHLAEPAWLWEWQTPPGAGKIWDNWILTGKMGHKSVRKHWDLSECTNFKFSDSVLVFVRGVIWHQEGYYCYIISQMITYIKLRRSCQESA